MKHEVTPENADRFRQWIESRGGIAVWQSINLSNPGASWSTPALTEDGQPYPQPTWQAENTPSRIITSMDDVVVVTTREVKRFHVGVRRSSNGLQMKVTDAGSNRIHREVERAGDGASYAFDYGCQDAVILVPDKTVPLSDYRS